MKQSKQEQSRGKHNGWSVLPATVLLALGAGLAAHDYLTVSAPEARDVIYAKYGECLEGTPYALGHTAVRYANEVAQLTPTDMPGDTAVDALKFDMQSGLGGLLAHPDEAAELSLERMGCEPRKSLWHS